MSEQKSEERIGCSICGEKANNGDTNRIIMMRDGINRQETESITSQIVFDIVCNRCAEMLQNKNAVEIMVLSYLSKIKKYK